MAVARAMDGRGGNGTIYQLDKDVFTNGGAVQRLLGRTAHVGAYEMRVDNLRMQIRRGVGAVNANPEILLRCNRDNKGFSPWKRKGLGRQGDRSMTIEFGGYGSGHAFQFEWMVTDDCQVDLSKLEWQTTRLGD